MAAALARDNITADFAPIIADAAAAVPWLLDYSEDFQECCAMAGLNPRSVLENAAALLTPLASKYEVWANALAMKATAAKGAYPSWEAFTKAKSDKRMMAGYDPKSDGSKEDYLKHHYEVFQGRAGLTVTGSYNVETGKALALKAEKKAAEGLKQCARDATDLAIRARAGINKFEANKAEDKRAAA
jgi:hypothetical protein